MPTETLSPPPAAPAAPAAPASPAPSPGSVPSIHVTPAAIDKGPVPEPPKKGSARERMFNELRKKAGETPVETTPEKPPETPTEPVKPAAETPAAPEEKKGKISPWKLVDEHKAARAKAEQELAELRKTMADPAKVKEIEEKHAALEKHARELEEEIRYVNYSKHPEFIKNYKEPYERAWKKAMSDLGELTIRDEAGGTERPMEPRDLLNLVNMDLRTARAQAVEIYGDFADDVMAARKEIKSLFEAQQNALENARKSASDRDQQMQLQMKERGESLRKEVMETWQKANQEITSDERIAKFFKPTEGDEEGNKRLAKGYEMADRAFHVTPNNPNLTSEERADIVRLHAAVRNRAAAFGKVSYQNQLLESKIAALTEELNKFKSTQPGAGAGRQEKPAVTATARDSVFAALRAKAH